MLSKTNLRYESCKFSSYPYSVQNYYSSLLLLTNLNISLLQFHVRFLYRAKYDFAFLKDKQRLTGFIIKVQRKTFWFLTNKVTTGKNNCIMRSSRPFNQCLKFRCYLKSSRTKFRDTDGPLSKWKLHKILYSNPPPHHRGREHLGYVRVRWEGNTIIQGYS